MSSSDTPGLLTGAARHAFFVLAGFSLWFAILFSPVLLEGRLFPSDGMLATFQSPKGLWNPLPFAGVPALGDPQLAQLYPLRWVFAALPSEIAFNYYIAFAYVLASSLTYGYVLRITRSTVAAIVGGLVFGASGYMVAHLGHTGLVTAVVWMPLIIWSLEELRQRFSARWFVTGALSVMLAIIAGHPQAFVHSLYLATAYALFLGSRSAMGWWRYVAMFAAIVAFGAALAAPQLLPAMELASASVRNEMTFAAFKEYAVPPAQVLTLLFPYLFGGGVPPVSQPFIGQWNLAETMGYVGLLPLMLAAIGSWLFRAERLLTFWIVVALVAFLLVLGDRTPLLSVTYYLPVINKLRAPGRHFQEMTFALAVLAAFGVKALQTRRIPTRTALRIAIAAVLVVLAALLVVALNYARLQTRADLQHITLPAFSANLAVWIPIGMLLLGVLALVNWIRNRDGITARALIVAVVAIDLASFGFFAEWRYAPDNRVLAAPDYAAKYARELNQSQQRIMPMRGYLEPLPGFSPTMSQLYSMPNASGYGPLLIRRYAELSRVLQNGWIDPAVLAPANRAADLIAARYVVVASPRGAAVSKDGVVWSDEDLRLALGSGCGNTNPTTIRIRLPAAVSADHIGIVSWTGCSTDLKQDEVVARVTLIDENRVAKEHFLRAGRETAEWAIECADVRPMTKHAVAPIFGTWDNVRNGSAPCQGHSFLAYLPVEPRRYSELLLEWLPKTPNSLVVSKLSLVDEASHRAFAITPNDVAIGDGDRFEFMETIADSSIYKNLRALPRAWLVPRVISARPAQILEAIRTSVAPDGTAFDPGTMAFVEEPFSLDSAGSTVQSNARVMELSGDKLVVSTEATAPAFLVLSEVYFPGWVAAVDDRNTEVFQTDYALRGVAVPSGKHIVTLRYRPSSFLWGLVIAAVALTGLIAIVIRARRQG